MAASDTESEDEDTKQAIAMSLDKPSPAKPAAQSDDEDEDLKRAIAMSLAEAVGGTANRNLPGKTAVDNSNGKAKSNNTVKAQTASKSISTTSITGILGLDRKAMEEERLARLASRKRPAPVSPPRLTGDKGPSHKMAKLEATTRTAPNTAPTSTNFPSLQYPRGVVKRTWSRRHPRDNDIKIEEVLNRDNLKTAVLSSFQWDQEWIFSKINIKTTKVIVVMEAKGEEERTQFTRDAEEIGLRVCCPPIQGLYTCMHSKLMLLFYEKHLRIVVPTANLVPYDWGETGIMENSVFLIDLPRRKDGNSSKDDLNFFGQELMYFLEKMGLQENARLGVLNFDFSNTTHLAFVHSTFGSHFDIDRGRNGLPGLSRAVKHLDLACKGTLELDFTASSIGSLNDLLVNTLYEAARGVDVIDQGRNKLKHPNPQTKEHLRIYFPTEESVNASIGGPDNGGTICLQKKYFEKPDFPKAIFRDFRSKREGLLSHNKILFARGHKFKSDGAMGTVAWAYVGSANMSESAWGRIVMDKTRKAPKLTCNNWECGVLISVPNPSPNTLDESLDDVFKGVVDVPFQAPARKYEGKKPWFFMEH